MQGTKISIRESEIKGDGSVESGSQKNEKIDSIEIRVLKMKEDIGKKGSNLFDEIESLIDIYKDNGDTKECELLQGVLDKFVKRLDDTNIFFEEFLEKIDGIVLDNDNDKDDEEASLLLDNLFESLNKLDFELRNKVNSIVSRKGDFTDGGEGEVLSGDESVEEILAQASHRNSIKEQEDNDSREVIEGVFSEEEKERLMNDKDISPRKEDQDVADQESSSSAVDQEAEKLVNEVAEKDAEGVSSEKEKNKIYRNFSDVIDLSKTYKYNQDGSETNERDFARDAAKITLSKIERYDLLNAETEQEGDEKFKQETQRLWKDLAVHGVLGYKNGKPSLFNFGDLDGRSSLALLKRAGINTGNVEYIKPGEHVGGFLNIDTGNQNGLVLLDENGQLTAYMDHHGDEAGNDTSAAAITYKTLVELGLLEREECLDEAVEFVTQMDNKTFPDAGQYFKDSYRNLLGLQRYIEFEKLVEFFKDGKNPTDNLSEDEIVKYGFVKNSKNRSNELKTVIEDSLRQLDELKKNGFIVESEKFGKVVVDVGGKVQAGFNAVVAEGYDTYIKWGLTGGGFFITSKFDFPEDFKLDDGIKPRSKMWLRPAFDETPVKTNMGDVLRAFLGGDFQFEGELKELVEKSDEYESDIKSGLDIVLNKYSDLSKRKEILELYLSKIDNKTKDGFLLESEILIELQKIDDRVNIDKLVSSIESSVVDFDQSVKDEYDLKVKPILFSYERSVKSGSDTLKNLSLILEDIQNKKKTLTEKEEVNDAGSEDVLSKEGDEVLTEVSKDEVEIPEEQSDEKIDVSEDQREDVAVEDRDKSEKIESEETGEESNGIEKELINDVNPEDVLLKRRNEILVEIEESGEVTPEQKMEKSELNARINEIRALKALKKEIEEEIESGNESRKSELEEIDNKIAEIIKRPLDEKSESKDIQEESVKNGDKKVSEDVVGKLGLNISIESIKNELSCIIEGEEVALVEESKNEIIKMIENSGVEFSEEEKNALIKEMSDTLNEALDAEAIREFSNFSNIIKYHSKVLAVGLGVGTVAGLVSSGFRMVGGGALKSFGLVVAGAVGGGGAGFVRSKVRTWLNPVVSKIKKENSEKLQKIREEKKAEVLKSENIKLVAVQKLKETLLQKMSKSGGDEVDYFKNISEFLDKNEGVWNSLEGDEREKMAKSLSVLAKVSSENNKKLADVVEKSIDGRWSQDKRSAAIGAIIGASTGAAQAIADSPYAPSIVGGVMGGVAMSGAIESKMAEWEKEKEEKKIVDMINKTEVDGKGLSNEEIKSYLESDKLNKYPLVKEKAKNILIDRLLKNSQELNRDKIDNLNEEVKKQFERKKWQKAASYAIGIGVGVTTGVVGRYLFESFSGRSGDEKEIPLDIQREDSAADKEILSRLGEISKKDQEYIKEHGLDDYLTRENINKSFTNQSVEESGPQKIGVRVILPQEETTVPEPTAEELLDNEIERLNVDQDLKDELLELDEGQKLASLDLLKKLPLSELNEKQTSDILEKIDDISELKNTVSRIYGDINAVSEEMKSSDNFTRVLKRIMNSDETSDETKKAFIGRVDKLTDGQVLKGGDITNDNVEELTKKAIDRLSAANIGEVDEKLDVKNLVYKGNILKINSETGEWSVEKGSASHAADHVSEVRLRESAVDDIARKLGFSKEQVKHIEFGGDSKNLDSRNFRIKVDDSVVHVKPGGDFEVSVDGQNVEGHLDGAKGNVINQIHKVIEDAKDPLRDRKWVEEEVEGYGRCEITEEDFDKEGRFEITYVRNLDDDEIVDAIVLHEKSTGQQVADFYIKEGESVKSFISRAEDGFAGLIQNRERFLSGNKIGLSNEDLTKCGVNMYEEKAESLLEKARFIESLKGGGTITKELASKAKIIIDVNDYYFESRLGDKYFVNAFNTINPSFYNNFDRALGLIEMKMGDEKYGLLKFLGNSPTLKRESIVNDDGILEVTGVTKTGAEGTVLLDLKNNKIGLSSDDKYMDSGVEKSFWVFGKKTPNMDLNARNLDIILSRLASGNKISHEGLATEEADEEVILGGDQDYDEEVVVEGDQGSDEEVIVGGDQDDVAGQRM